MPQNILLNLIEAIQSWDQLEKRIATLPTEQHRGEAFEEFCQAFFLLDPVFQFKDVYRQEEIPPSIPERLGYPGVQDIGIDGVGITHEGQIHAYQAKFRSNRKTTPTLRELSTFFTLSDKADWRITIANCDKLPTAIDNRVRQSRVLADRFDSLEPDFFHRLETYLKTQCVSPPIKKTPHITQKEAIDAAVSHYGQHKRGQLILPCGAGKTLASIWITEKLDGKNILIMVPSLSLMSQTLTEWAYNASIPFRYLCVCSDTTVDLGNDAPIENISDMNVPVTTEYERIRDFLVSETPKASIVFSTYQSSKVLSEAVRNAGITFDVGIFDEAHRTTGTKIGAWGIALDDANVPVHKRIFMTATPKIYAPHITKKAKEEDILICSMDDTDVYGQPFYEIGFAEAVDRGHITDYKVIVICVTDSEVKEIIEKGGRVITDQSEWDAKALAKRVALVKGIRAYGLRKAFTFHGKVASAKSFTDTSKPYGINHIFDLIEPEKNQQKRMGYFHVNGMMPSGTRSNILKEFESVDIGIMSNARCLVEGVNIPAVDTVAFIDPKRSLIDIVQATGRAMRKADWKENGYIFIPVILGEDSDPEQIIRNSDFDTVWKVLQAMLDQDQRMQGIVSRMRVLQGKGEEGTRAWKDAMNEYADKIEFYDLPIKVDEHRFIEKLNTKIVEIVGRTWDFWYGLTLAYKEEYGDANAPGDYKGFRLGGWQITQRQHNRIHKLSEQRIKMLDDIEFKWEPHNEAFEKGFEETLKYKEQTGDANAPQDYTTSEGFRLGSWQGAKRNQYKKGKLPQNRFLRLEKIGFKWTLLDENFTKGFEETLKYKAQFGNPHVPKNYNTSDGFPLGQWQNSQRYAYLKGRMDPKRIKQFEEIGYDWHYYKKMLDENWEKAFRETMKYLELNGDPHAPYEYVTPEGFPLGQWQTDQKQFYKRSKLSQDRVEKLENIGFKWDKYESELNSQFESNFDDLLKYRETFGHTKVPPGHKTKNGKDLGTWVMFMRKYHKKGRLSKDRIERLNSIGFEWKPKSDFIHKSFSRGSTVVGIF